MKKIGLYLGGNPKSGGVFQYNIAMLEAVAALPAETYKCVVFYSSVNWEKYVGAYEVEAYCVSRSFVHKAAMVLWSGSGLPIKGWRKLSPIVSRFVKRFVKERCDLWIFPTQDAVAYHLPVPAISTVHDLMHRYESRFPEVSRLGTRRIRDAHYRNTCRWSKAVLVDSRVGKVQLIESYGIAEDKVFVLPFTPPKYINATDAPEDFDKRFELPEKYIFYPAQFWEHKNHKALVRALKLIGKEAPELSLVFVGNKKNAYGSIAELAAQLHLEGKVKIFGYVDDADMPELYRRAVAMMMPTYFGPTNIPPLEAFTCGCPCAVSSIYGMPEQVGEAALLFDPDSDREISAAMLDLYRNEALRSSLTEKGYKQEIGRAHV
jgi:glycosyltransferase involved in cell wall biosynthesis